jgi:hypothetical protein
MNVEKNFVGLPLAFKMVFLLSVNCYGWSSVRTVAERADLSVFGPEVAAGVMGVERYGFWLSTISVVFQLLLWRYGFWLSMISVTLAMWNE